MEWGGDAQALLPPSFIARRSAPATARRAFRARVVYPKFRSSTTNGHSAGEPQPKRTSAPTAEARRTQKSSDGQSLRAARLCGSTVAPKFNHEYTRMDTNFQGLWHWVAWPGIFGPDACSLVSIRSLERILRVYFGVGFTGVIPIAACKWRFASGSGVCRAATNRPVEYRNEFYGTHHAGAPLDAARPAPPSGCTFGPDRPF